MFNNTKMENRSKPAPNVRGCKKHPKHHQSPGVCSLCLREKLSKLPTSSRSNTTTMLASSCNSSSSLSSLSSNYSSSESSPVHHRSFVTSGPKGSISFLKTGRNVLGKSRSVAFDGRDGKKKGGFWSKLLNSRRTRMDESFMQSRTIRERVTTTTRVH